MNKTFFQVLTAATVVTGALFGADGTPAFAVSCPPAPAVKHCSANQFLKKMPECVMAAWCDTAGGGGKAYLYTNYDQCLDPNTKGTIVFQNDKLTCSVPVTSEKEKVKQ